VEQLGHDQVGDLIRDRRPEEDDALVEEAGVDVERALSARGLLDDHRDKWAHGPRFVSLGGWNSSPTRAAAFKAGRQGSGAV
jgi:hypothetical protein